MAQKNTNANPIANFYEAQTTATAEIVQAALNGMQRLQQLTLQALRTGAGGQFSLAQSMAGMRDGGDVSRAMAEGAAPAAEQSARYQRELLQAITEMNSDIVRASYSMMERMRDALGAASQGQGMASGFAGMPAMPGMPSSESMTNPMALYDSAMRQWQTAVQQMMETPSVAMAVSSAEDAMTRASPVRPSKKSSKSAGKRKSSAGSR
ncbi:MAG: TIGR01841 family phasin [Burkholderiaceae bacterium]|nr:TIGR01841 family phasin [Burkholderiaceae bacterium]